jgi:cytochrome c553
MASFPQLAGKDADYISGRLKQYRSGETVGPNSGLMIPMARDLSDDEIANLAAYLSAAPE